MVEGCREPAGSTLILYTTYPLLFHNIHCELRKLKPALPFSPFCIHKNNSKIHTSSNMFRRTFILFFAFLACSVSAQPNIINNKDLDAQARKPETYLPKNARSCEQAVTMGDTKYCRSCNKEATIGAAQRVTIQVGGCTTRRLEEVEGTAENSQGEARELRADKLRVAEFTNERATFFEPVAGKTIKFTGVS